MNPIRDELSTGSIGNPLFENSLHSKQYSMSPSLLNNSSLSDIHRLREDFVNQTTKHLSTPWEDQILQATKACEVWKSEADESNRKVCTIQINVLVPVNVLFVQFRLGITTISFFHRLLKQNSKGTKH